MTKRLIFANHHINQSTNWNNILFTDESYFEIGNSKQMICRRHGDHREEVLCKKVAHPFKLMVWGGISGIYMTPLIIYHENTMMTAEIYVQTVFKERNFVQHLNQLFPNGWTFMQYNASPHTAILTKKYHEER